ncbi:MAG: 2Fe-2S iron-sulfur cluster-binding protein [Halarsenatibacteraceae bacterium]
MAEKNMVNLIIDGKNIYAAEGENLLKVAWDNDIDIPGLCYHPRLTFTASCRLCVVKVNDRDDLVPACTLEVEKGMNITAFDPEIERHRTNLLDLMLSRHECDCVMCDSAGDCELQELGYRYGLIGLSPEKFRKVYGSAKNKHEQLPLLKYLTYDSEETKESETRKTASYSGEPKDCIRCGYCVEACPNDLYPVLIMEAVAYDQPELYQELSPDDCINCGLCSYVCPARIKLPDFFYTDDEVISNK